MGDHSACVHPLKMFLRLDIQGSVKPMQWLVCCWHPLCLFYLSTPLCTGFLLYKASLTRSYKMKLREDYLLVFKVLESSPYNSALFPFFWPTFSSVAASNFDYMTLGQPWLRLRLVLHQRVDTLSNSYSNAALS